MADAKPVTLYSPNGGVRVSVAAEKKDKLVVSGYTVDNPHAKSGTAKKAASGSNK